MGWVNYPDFRMGVLDRGTRLQPEIALRSLASAEDVLIDTRGAIKRRPGFEDQGVDLDYEFVTIPYFTEEETYLLAITYGDHVFEFSDAAESSSTGSADRETPDAGDQTWNPSPDDKRSPQCTHFQGKIYLYKVDQENAETSSTNVGFVTPQAWATTENDYLFGTNFSIRRGQGSLTVVNTRTPNLYHYLHPWTKAQCKTMQYAQHGSSLFLFIDGFPTLEIKKSGKSFRRIIPTHTKVTADHASVDPETGAFESSYVASSESEAWILNVDVLEPEVSRNISPPVNLLLESATKIVASDDFFTADMQGGFISYGSTKMNLSNDKRDGDWALSGVLVRIEKVINSRIATVSGLSEGDAVADDAGDLVRYSYTSGNDIYQGKHPGTNIALTQGDLSTLSSPLLGDWSGPWIRTKPYVRTTDPGTLNVVPASFKPTVSGSPHHGWDEISGFNSAERADAGIGFANYQAYYYVDTDEDLGTRLKEDLELSELDVGCMVVLRTTAHDYVFCLYNVTSTNGQYDFSGHLRYHFQQWGQFSSATRERADEPGQSNLVFSGNIDIAKYKVPASQVVMGCMGWHLDPSNELGQATKVGKKATVYVNDPEHLPSGLEVANRPVKKVGVSREFRLGTDALPTTEIDNSLECPVVAGGSIFFRNGVFRPTARVSPVCYEGYWETLPSTGTPQNFVSFGAGGSTKFARCGTAHQGRLAVGGFSGAFEDAVVFSRTGEPKQLMTRTIDDAADPFSIQLGQSTEEQVSWFASAQTGLLVGGKTGEYIVKGEPISAMKVGFQRISSVGGAIAKPTYTDSEIVFVGRDKRTLGGVITREGADQTTFSQRLSDRASSLFSANIVSTGYIYSPHPTFFFLLEDGKCLTFTRDQVIGGFTEFSHANGTIKSISSAVRSAKISDSVFACVKRVIGNSTKYRLERMNFDALLDSQRCTTPHSISYTSDEGTIVRNSITTDKIRFLNSWAGNTVSLVTEDSAGNRVYRGEFPVQVEVVIRETSSATDSGVADHSSIFVGDQIWTGSTDTYPGQMITDYYIDISSLGLSEAPSKAIIGFNFNGTFAPSSVTPVPGYLCSFTSGIVLGESVSGLTVDKGDVVAVKENVTPLSESGWINTYNLGHYSRDAGPTFTLKGPFSSTIHSVSVEVDSED